MAMGGATIAFPLPPIAAGAGSGTGTGTGATATHFTRAQAAKKGEPEPSSTEDVMALHKKIKQESTRDEIQEAGGGTPFNKGFLG